MQCKGKLETDILYVVVSKTVYSCVSKLARMKVKVKLDNCRKNYGKRVCACTYNL
jgi:hypothetical protein